MTDLFERGAFARRLREGTIAVRLLTEKMGVRKALTREQIRQAADEFDADARHLSATKRLIDTKDPSYRAVVRVRSRAVKLWKAVTVPYPDPGVRLCPRERVEALNGDLQALRTELAEAANVLQRRWTELRDQAQTNLGQLFNAADYPERVDTEFAIHWDYPSIEPAEYLRQAHPQLYEQERERIRLRFEEAAELTEQAFAARLHELVAHLVDRLTGQDDGKPKTFKDSSVDRLREFFEQVRGLSVAGESGISRMVDMAQAAIGGATADQLRGDSEVRNRVGAQLAAVAQTLDSLMVERPRRRIELGDGGAAVAPGATTQEAA